VVGHGPHELLQVAAPPVSLADLAVELVEAGEAPGENGMEVVRRDDARHLQKYNGSGLGKKRLEFLILGESNWKKVESHAESSPRLFVLFNEVHEPN
jgi:hypothetical protein